MSRLHRASLAVAAAILSVADLSSPALGEDLSDRDGLYLSGTVGYTKPDDPDVTVGAASAELDMDDSFSGTLALGSYFSAFRMEAELGYRQNDFEVAFTGPELFDPDGELEQISGMVNGFFDIPVGDRLSIYIGAGVGVAFATLELGAQEEDGIILAYQGMAGVGWQLADGVTGTLGYRAFTTSDYDFDIGDVDSPLIHTAEIGLRFDLQ